MTKCLEQCKGGHVYAKQHITLKVFILSKAVFRIYVKQKDIQYGMLQYIIFVSITINRTVLTVMQLVMCDMSDNIRYSFLSHIAVRIMNTYR